MRDGMLAGALLELLAKDGAAQSLAAAMIEKAASGDVRAFEIIRNTIGEKPKDKTVENTKTEIKWTGQ